MRASLTVMCPRCDGEIDVEYYRDAGSRQHAPDEGAEYSHGCVPWTEAEQAVFDRRIADAMTGWGEGPDYDAEDRG